MGHAAPPHSPPPASYVPPTSTGDLHPDARAAHGPAHANAPAAWGAPAPHPYGRPRAPPHVGTASACTATVGGVALLFGVLVLLGAASTALFWDIGAQYAGPWMPRAQGAVVGILLIVSVIPVVYGAVALNAASGITRGDPASWSTAVAVHVLSLALGLVTVWGVVGLLHAVPSGVALWALFRSDTRAFLGQ